MAILRSAEDARNWFFNYLKKLKESKEGQEVVDRYALKRYNQLDISAENAEKLKQEVLKQNDKQDGLVAKALWFMKGAVKSR